MTDVADLDFDAAANAAEDGEALVIDLDGFEGPLHVLLALARTQRVDLLRLSITALADQYLAFIHAARKRCFSLAADYLVMAAWRASATSTVGYPAVKVSDVETGAVAPPYEEMVGVD